jgi:hypothetical protein
MHVLLQNQNGEYNLRIPCAHLSSIVRGTWDSLSPIVRAALALLCSNVHRVLLSSIVHHVSKSAVSFCASHLFSSIEVSSN